MKIKTNPALGEEEEGKIARGCHYDSNSKTCDLESCFCDVLLEETTVVSAVDSEWDIPTLEYIPDPNSEWWQTMLALGGES